MILSGLVVSWIRSANSLAVMFNEAMETTNDTDSTKEEPSASENEIGGAEAAAA